MELQSLFSLIPCFLFLFFIYKLAKITKSSKHSKSVKKLPPGPKKLPFIGNLHHFVGALPNQALTNLAKKYGPLMHLQLGEISTIVVSSPEMAREIFKTHDLAFVDRWNFLSTRVMFYDQADIVFSPYGDYWRQMRKICIVELLSNKSVQSFRSIRENEVWRLVSSIRSSSGLRVDIPERVYAMTSVITSRATFGTIIKDQDKLTELMKELVLLFGGLNMVDLFPSMKWLHIITGSKAKLMNLHRKLDAFLEKIIDIHATNRKKTEKGNGEKGEEDLVDVLLRLQETGDFDFPITRKNIKALILDMFTGGTETSSKTVEWAMAELIRDPRVMGKVQAEIRQVLKGKKRICEADIQGLTYLKLVVQETLRLHPAILPRECREECEIDGYTIPAKTKVFINAFAIGRDPSYWKDPNTFMPERFENSPLDYTGNHYEYIPFGAGRRICPGLSFGLANTEFPLAQLLYHFDWKLPNGMKSEDLDMTETPGTTAGRKNNLCLIATPYAPSFDE